MSNHATALVPIETWAYQSPELRYRGVQVDIGLFAESLIYYDEILLNVGNQTQFAELLRWLVARNSLDDFLALVNDGTIRMYEYSFVSVPILKEGKYVLMNVQDQIQEKPDTFEQRYLYHPSVEAIFPRARHRKRLYRAFRDRVIEVKAGQFGVAIENARSDFLNPQRAAHILLAFLDSLFAFRNLGQPPQVTATATEGTIQFNIDMNKVAELAGSGLNIHKATSLNGNIISNRLLWSAAEMRCDLFLPSPIASLVGDKLYETELKVRKTQEIIGQLKASIEFPDIRQLINAGELNLREILWIRQKARRFRDWLQDEASRDRDAIIAYHHEVARENDLLRFGRGTLRLLGVVGGGALGGMLGAMASPDIGAAAAAGAAGSASGYLLDLGSRIGAGWKPVVFGNWMRDRIAKLLSDG